MTEDRRGPGSSNTNTHICSYSCTQSCKSKHLLSEVLSGKVMPEQHDMLFGRRTYNCLLLAIMCVCVRVCAFVCCVCAHKPY